MNELLQTIIPGTDLAIIEKINGGDTASFELLIRRYNPLLYKIARSYGFNHHDAEDLMQDAHIAAYQNLSRFEGRASYKTWASKIMVNKCLYKINHGHQRNELAEENLSQAALPPLHTRRATQPDESSINRELALVLERSLQNIPATYRTVFVLREIEGFSVKETAGLLGLTDTNVKVRLNRAKAQLQKEIEQTYSQSEVYSFNLVYCDGIVQKVFVRLQHPSD